MEMIGHGKIVESLRKKIKDGSYSQAYIFSGPERVGKHFLAENFARGIVKGKDFLDLSPKEISEAELDILRIRPEREEKKGVVRDKDITVDQIKEAQKSLSTFPHSGKAKVLIIDDSDRMNLKAQNAMLKTIEEPNSTAVIILIASRSERLLPTVKSRCQLINFNLVSDEEMEKYLSSRGAPLAKEAVDFSMGRPGNMLEMIEDPEKMERYRDSKKKMLLAIGGSINEKMKIAEEFSKNVPESLDQLNFWLWTLQRSGSVENILRSEGISEASAKLKNTNANARLVLEDTFLNLK